MSNGRHWVRAAAALLAAAVLATPGVATAKSAEPPGLPSSYSAPPAPAVQLENRGSPISSLTVVEGAFGTASNGDLVAYAAPMGENAALNVSSVTFPAATTQSGTYPMPGASGDATIAVAPDGGVYVGTFYQGHLFRYDPKTTAMTDLGVPSEGATYLYGLTVAPDGTVYGGTYPTAHVWSYSPSGGFTDLGAVTDDPTIKYVRSTVYDPAHHALYAGTQADGRLFRMDLATREVSGVALEGSATSISDLDYAQGRVLVNYGGSLRVVDTATATEVPVHDGDAGGATTTTYPLAARGVSEGKAGGVYFSTVADGVVALVRYDLATDTVQLTGNTVTRGALIGYGFRHEDVGWVLYGFAGNYSGGGFRYELSTGASSSLQFQISPAPSPLQHVLPTADGRRVFVNAFLNGNTSVYDVASGGSTAVARVGQVEDWVLDGDSVQAGTYPYGSLVSLPAATGTPVTTFTRLQDSDQQIRPIEAKVHDGRIWYGTEPDYGLHGGAIAVLDPASGEVAVTRDIVPDHSISALEFDGDTVIAGSTTTGGTGTDPAPGDARLARWDPVAKQVLTSTTPVAGAGSITALSVRDGLLYGLADSTLFVADPKTLEVRRTLSLGVAPGAANSGELWFHPNGYLYVSVGDSVMVVDPLALEATTLVHGSTQRLEPSSTGVFWTTLRPSGFQSYLELGELIPAATPCGTADTRQLVTVRGRATSVRNRFVRTGCTLQDLFPVKPSGRAYAATVQRFLHRLEATGTISRAERRELWVAATRR